MSDLYWYVLIAYIIWNVFTFLLYGLDKLKAKKGYRRISEANLLWVSFAFGAIGACFGSKVFHHKTLKTKFRICLPIALILNIIVAVAFVYCASSGAL